MDVVSTALAGVAPPGVPDVQGHLARPLDHQGAKSREEGQGKIKGRSTVAAPKPCLHMGLSSHAGNADRAAEVCK
jgi:hypothetical protein